MTTPDDLKVPTMKANDLLPVVRDVLTYEEVDPDDALAVARRTEALAELAAKLAEPGVRVTFILSAADEQWNPLAGVPKVNSPARVEDAAARLVEYEWDTGDSDTPGRWLYEWEVIGSDSKPQTFPGRGYNRLAIGADLDGDGSATA